MNLKEKIIVANGISETELLKSYAKCGISSFGLRIMTPYTFAIYALEKNGIFLNKTYISSEYENAIVYNEIQHIPYYKNMTYADTIELFASLDELRIHILSDERKQILQLEKGEFKDKNSALIEIYQLYMQKLEAENAMDTIETLRYVITQGVTLDAEIIVLEEFPLKPLEEELVKIVSNQSYKKQRLYNCEPSKILIKKYTKAFGIRNEIEAVINEILLKNIPFDQVMVVCMEPNVYSKYLYDYCDELHIPYTSGINRQIYKTNVGKLYFLLMDYVNNYSDKNTFLEMVNDVSFDKNELMEILEDDKCLEAVGNLRLKFGDEVGNNKKITECLKLYETKVAQLSGKSQMEAQKQLHLYQMVSKIIPDFNLGLISFLKNFVQFKTGQEDMELLVLKKMEALYQIADKYHISFEKIEETVSNLSTGSMQSCEGKLYITSLTKAMSVYRPYVFIVGLNSNYFPGSPKENSNLLDSDYEIYGISSKSEKNIDVKREAFMNFIDVLNYNKANIYLSYASYNEQTLKEQNSSSVLFEIYKREYGDGETLITFSKKFGTEDKFETVQFFNFDLSKNSNLGRKYCEIEESDVKKKFEFEKIIKKPNEGDVEFKNQSISATKLTDFVECPAKFYFKYILKLETIFKIRNELGGIEANDLGTLIHTSLEELDKETTTKEEYVENGMKLFDEFLITHVPVNQNGVLKQKKDLERLFENAYDMKPQGKVLIVEDDVSLQYETLKIHGYPDAIIQLPNEDIQIIDYKVKSKISHDPNEIDTILQIVFYAYIAEKVYNIHIKEGSYMYIKQNKPIKVDDLQGKYKDLEEKLDSLAAALNKGEFPYLTKEAKKGREEDPCQYCDFKSICNGGK